MEKRKMSRSMDEQMRQRGSAYRNKVAHILQLWKRHRSLLKLEAITGIRHRRLGDILRHSKTYRRRKYYFYRQRLQRLLDKNRNGNKKSSSYRNKVAICLRTWKRLRSITETAKEMGEGKYIMKELLSQSKWYTKRQRYSTYEKEYANIWALKLKMTKILGGKCQKCGNSNIFVLEFHHREGKDKCISDMIRRQYNKKEDIYREANKCVVLCRNCHQEIHNKKAHPKNEKNKRFIMNLIQNKGKCVECGYSRNISCLEFHHKNPRWKKFDISQLTDPRRNYDNMKISNDKLNSYIREVKKCDILCCNCHQLKQVSSGKFQKLKLLIQISERLLSHDKGTCV